jgi:hypothetical protein
MKDAVDGLAKKLEPIFKGLPPLPKNAKDWFVKYWPILALVFGVLQLVAAWSLWHTGHLVNQFADYANTISQVYGTGAVVHHLGLFYWLSLITLVLSAVILLAAYPGLKAKRKDGWNMLFLGTMVNFVYGVVVLFDTNYGGFGKLVSSLIGTAISLYFLYQVRSYYVKGEQKAE